MTRLAAIRRARGFTLVELAVVIMIVALLLGGLVATLDAQNNARSASQTEQSMQLARDALVGFALRQGRLPCPAVENIDFVGSLPAYWQAHAAIGYRDGAATRVDGTGEEAMAVTSTSGSPESTVNGRCADSVGFLPALTLGIGPTDAQGFLLDGWGGRVMYAVSDSPGSNPRDFTTTGRLRTLGFAVTPNLYVCTSASTNKPVDCGAANPGARVPAIILSRGKNFAQPAGGGDETDNNDGDRFFVSHTPGPSFDDQMIWLSESVLYARMIAGNGF
ncbi:MAG: prepilin-type N-terminal cleavage/methylation domain-containing protein [Burkholderiales bacterium]|nr:prepilin-type N-terminal cleavage/methylation domain-containing protein [Burkholderiales bacterium]